MSKVNVVMPVIIPDCNCVVYAACFSLYPQHNYVGIKMHDFFKAEHDSIYIKLAQINWRGVFRSCANIDNLLRGFHQVVKNFIDEFVSLSVCTSRTNFILLFTLETV